MSDVVERLRESDNETEYVSPIGDKRRLTLAWEAAAEIERLQYELGIEYLDLQAENATLRKKLRYANNSLTIAYMHGRYDRKKSAPVEQEKDYRQKQHEFSMLQFVDVCKGKNCNASKAVPHHSPECKAEHEACHATAPVEQAYADAVTTGTGILLDGKRVDPKDFYAAPVEQEVGK